MEVHKVEFRLETIPTLMMEPNAHQGLLSNGIRVKEPTNSQVCSKMQT